MKNKSLNFRSLLYLILMVTSSTHVFANWQGCVKDKCSGKPLVHFPITYCQPVLNGGVGGCTTYYTDASGCFSIAASMNGASITVGGVSSTYNGGGWIQLGNISAYAITGTQGILNIPFAPFYTGNVNDVDVANYQVRDCGNPLEQNLLGFSGLPSSDIITGYCVKILVYKKVGTSLSLVKTVDWTPLFDSRSINPLINVNQILLNFPKATYKFVTTIKCCDEALPSTNAGPTVFNGSFVWNPPITPGDAQYLWSGSSTTETVNQDGNLFNNTHPNDGQIWRLGQNSVGVVFPNALTGSSSVTKITYTLEKSIDATGQYTTIYTTTTFPTSGQQVSSLNFNSWTSGYFNFNGPKINNIPNTFFPILYSYNDQFRFTVKVWGSQQCPPKVATGEFKIYDGDTNARVVNSKVDKISLAYEGDADSGINIESRSKDLVSNEAVVFPNPTTGILNIKDLNLTSGIQITDQVGKVVRFETIDNTIDISDLPAGIYHLKYANNNKSKTIKIVKI